MQARPGRKPQSTREEQARPLASANMTFLGSVALERLEASAAWEPLKATASARAAASSGSVSPERAMERKRGSSASKSSDCGMTQTRRSLMVMMGMGR